MYVTRRVSLLAAGMVLLAGLGGRAPATRVAAMAALPQAQQADAAATLRQHIQRLLPKAVVQINRIDKTSSSALYVNLVAQHGATLTGGNGPQVLSWYVQAYPRQPIYALYSYEQDAAGRTLWEYEFVPANTVLRRYRLSFSAHPYPWYSWKLSKADLARAAQAGKWPSKAVVHQPAAPATTSPPKKKK
jgi:hypothetical protein